MKPTAPFAAALLAFLYQNLTCLCQNIGRGLRITIFQRFTVYYHHFLGYSLRRFYYFRT